MSELGHGMARPGFESLDMIWLIRGKIVWTEKGGFSRGKIRFDFASYKTDKDFHRYLTDENILDNTT